MTPKRTPNDSKLRPEALTRSVSFGEERNGKTRVTRPGTSPTSPEKKMYPLTSPPLTKRTISKRTSKKLYLGKDSPSAMSKPKPKTTKIKNFDSPSPRAPGAPKKAQKFTNFHHINIPSASFPAAIPDHYSSDSSSDSDSTGTEEDTSSESSSGSDTTETDIDTSSESSSDSDTPDAITPDGVTPDGVTPDGVTPDGVTPDGVTPDGVTPDGVTPDAITPDAVTPDAVTPDAVTPDATTHARGNVRGLAKGIDGKRKKKKAKKNKAAQKKRGVVKKGVVRRQKLPDIPQSELAKRRTTRSAKGKKFFSLP
ncbi:hypothetical protein SMMN14_08654 [Sphaerulina musiva]